MNLALQIAREFDGLEIKIGIVQSNIVKVWMTITDTFTN